MWTRGQATLCLKSGLKRVEGVWRSHGRVAVAEIYTGGVRAALREDSGGDKAAGDGIATVGDPERRKAGVAGTLGGTLRSNMEDLFVWIVPAMTVTCCRGLHISSQAL